MNNDKIMIKTMTKMIKNDNNSRKIAIFYFSEFFCTTGSKNDETNDKNMKNEKMKKT